MNKKAELLNLLNGSILSGSLMMIWIGVVLTYFPKEGALAWLILIVIVLVSVFSTQKFLKKSLNSWHVLSVIILSIVALIVSSAFQTREIWILFLLPAGVSIVGLINLIIFLIRWHMKKKAGLKEEAPTHGSPVRVIIASVTVVFILPAVLSGYMRFFMPPSVEVSYPRIVVYDYEWKGNKGSEKGLSLYCSPDSKGDIGRYDWIAAAYLVSREWYDSPEEIWKDEEYVRRARFYRLGVESFNRNERRDFESRKCTDDLFLPYHIIQKGVRQGDFKNYRVEPIENIISSSDRVQFAVEFITVVANRKGKRAVEGEYGKEKRMLIPLDEKATPFAGSDSGDERYFNSEWLKMVSGLTEGTTITEEKEIVSFPDEENPSPEEKKPPSDNIDIPDDLGEL